MKRASELAESCVTEHGRDEESPRVGAVAVDKNGVFIAEAYRGEDPRHPGDHAEFMLIQKAGGEGAGRLHGATVYTTLEPCTSRSKGKTPCATRLADEGVAVVYIGMFDPDPRVREKGWRHLYEAGIEVCDFTAEVREQVLQLNRPFVNRYQQGSGASGSATFDYEQNAGSFDITFGGATFHTKWSKSGTNSILALAHEKNIALARYAGIEAIDDPGAYDFSAHFKRPQVGQVVIYRNQSNYCLIRVDDIHSGPDYGHDRTEVSITWEVRLTDPT